MIGCMCKHPSVSVAAPHVERSLVSTCFHPQTVSSSVLLHPGEHRRYRRCVVSVV